MRVRERFVPDPTVPREDMRTLQDETADAAVFQDAFGHRSEMNSPTDGDPPADGALVAGVDQAFPGDDRAVSAVVVRRGEEVIERAHAVTALEMPYVPGLLAFREGPPVLAAIQELERRPDLLVVDGNGRIHYRAAGLATHLGVVLDLPTIGVAKRLLCGTPRSATAELSEGDRVPIEANDDVAAPAGTVIGHAVQTRQYDAPERHINPVYVSPGHRVSPETAVELVLDQTAGYKLPEPIRLADRYADEVATECA